MKRLASFISWVFLPLFTPIYGLLLVLYYPVYAQSFWLSESLFQMPPLAKLLFLSLFLAFIVLAPGVSFIMLKMNKTITSLKMPNQKERRTPISIMGFYCVVLFLFLQFQSKSVWIPPIINGMVLGGALASFLAYLINFRMKISLHSIGMGSLLGFIYMYSLLLEEVPLTLILLTAILGGIVGSARMILKSHSLREIAWGYGLGFVTQLICIYFYPIIKLPI